MADFGGDAATAPMKAMKLYDQVERIHNELALIEIGDAAPLTVEQLTPFDQYHYLGTEAVDEAIVALRLGPGMHVLDIGSGIGGPARYIAAASGAHVTALELQPDLDALAGGLRIPGHRHAALRRRHGAAAVSGGGSSRGGISVSAIGVSHLAGDPGAVAAGQSRRRARPAGGIAPDDGGSGRSVADGAGEGDEI